MDMRTAQRIYESLTKEKRDPDFTALLEQFLKDAVQYAHIRAEWYFKSRKKKIHADQARTAAHNSFISSCNILARYMKNNNLESTWREEIGEDRKVIGDFACYLHCLLGLRSR